MDTLRKLIIGTRYETLTYMGTENDLLKILEDAKKSLAYRFSSFQGVNARDRDLYYPGSAPVIKSLF